MIYTKPEDLAKGRAASNTNQSRKELNGAQMGVYAATELLDMLNRGMNINTLIETVLTDHRTLQQMYFNIVLQSIEDFANVQSYDGRNRAAVETARKLQAFMKENYINTRLPLI